VLTITDLVNVTEIGDFSVRYSTWCLVWRLLAWITSTMGNN